MKILFVDGTRGFAPSRLGEKATGGISTSLTLIPRLLAAKGHECYIKSIHDKDETVGGVRYLAMATPSPSVDFVVFNRNMVEDQFLAQARAASKSIVWWLHDIVDPTYLRDGSFHTIENIVSLSSYCTKTYSDFYGLAESKFTEIQNGVDETIFYPGS